MSVRKLGTNAIIYGIGGVLNRTISLLLLPCLTNYLSTEDFGRAGMLSILNVFLVAVFSLGIGGSLSSSYFNQETDEGKRRAIMTGVWLLIGSTAGMLLLMLPFSGWLAAHLLDSRDWSGLMVESLLTTAISIIAQPFLYEIQWTGRSRLFITLSSSSTLISASLNIFAVVGLKMGLHGWILSQLVGQLVSLVLYSTPFFRLGIPRPMKRILRTLLIQGIPMVPSFGFMYIIQQGNRYGVERFYGLDDLGVYNLAVALASASSFVVSAFQTSWVPYFMSYRTSIEEAKTVFGRATTWFAFLAGITTVCFFGFAQPVVELLTPRAFHDAWMSVGIAALANFLGGATNLLMPAQYFSEKLKHLAVIQAIAAAASIALNLIALSTLGAVGAGFALAASYLFLLLVHHIWNVRGVSMHLPIAYEWKRLAIVALCVVVSAVWTLWFPATEYHLFGFRISSVATGIARGCLLAAGTLCVLWISLPPESRRTALSRLRRRSEAAAGPNPPPP